MREKLLYIYASFFGRPGFIKMNRFLFHASLKGMGILNYKDDYISGEREFLKAFLKGKSFPVILDVGANVGHYAQLVFRYNPHASVHCFEPHPETYKRLKDGFNDSNFDVVLVNKGAGNVSKTGELFDYHNAQGTSHASLHKGVIESLHHEKAKAVNVEITDLESYIDLLKIDQIDLLKIDTEGNELNVLKGLGCYLEEGRVGAIHFEFNEMNILSKSSFRDFWELLHNYKLYRLLPNGRILALKKYIPVECELFAYQNIIAVKS